MGQSRISSETYEPLTKWSQRCTNGDRHELAENIRQILLLLSGADVTNMLLDVLGPSDKKLIAGKILLLTQKCKSKNKHFFLPPLKLANLSLNEVKDPRIKGGEKLWSR